MHATLKTVTAVLFCSAAAASTAFAADAVPGTGNKNVNPVTQAVYANPDGDQATKGVKTLQDYIVQEKELFEFLFENHPIFKYAERGDIVGVYKVSTRGSEYLGEGNAAAFDFNELSSGYAAVLDIVVDLIIRMESQTERRFDFSVAGIVLIDEIETHLHLELQRKILDLLTSIFPNIQFIMSTHSPFIINSVDNAVIYDLEKKLLVKDGLSDVPYTGIVEGYFNANEMSVLLQKKFDRYKELANKEKLTEEDFDEIAELEMYLNEVPDYLALNLTTEYQRLKEGLRSREDI